VLAIALGACGSSSDTRRAPDPRSIPAAEVAQQNLTTSPAGTVALPNLNDPAVRKQFVSSFADGYFTESQQPRTKSPTDGG
jgi:hypothetical protein